MVKQLLVMRHAKAERPEGVADRDRPLAPRGVRSSEAMGRILRVVDLEPEAILSSPALRARSTAELAVRGAQSQTGIELVEAIYDGSAEALLGVVRAVPEPVARMLLVGHNPGLELLTWMLCEGPGVRMPRAGVRLATGTVALVELGVDAWARVAPGCGQLEWILPPRVALAIRPDF